MIIRKFRNYLFNFLSFPLFGEKMKLNLCGDWERRELEEKN